MNSPNFALTSIQEKTISDQRAMNLLPHILGKFLLYEIFFRSPLSSKHEKARFSIFSY